MATEARMHCEARLAGKRLVVTCRPLVPDVTKDELYAAEAQMLSLVLDLLRACGIKTSGKVRLILDHE